MAVKVRWGTDSPRKRQTTWKTSSPSLTRSSFHDHLINISFVWYFEKCTIWSEIVYFEEKAELFTRKPSYQCQGVVRSWQRSYDMIRWHENTQCLHCMIVKVTHGWLLGFKVQDICMHLSFMFISSKKTKWDRIYERHMYTCYRHGYWNATGLLNERHIAWYLSIKIYFHKNDMKISPPRSEG